MTEPLDVAQLAQLHSQFLASYAVSLCGDIDQAHDLVQQTFERVLSTHASCLPQRSQRSWLVAVLRNLFIDELRKNARGLQRVDADLTLMPANDEEPPPPWCMLTTNEVHVALSSLDEPFAAAFRLHALEGRPYAEIADALDTSVRTVGTRILRARRKLRVLLSAPQ